MTTFFKKHSTVIFVLLLLTMLVLTWLIPSQRLTIEMAFLLCSFGLAIFAVVSKNWEFYLQGRFTQRAFVRSNIFDVLGILLSMTLAGLLAHYIAQTVMASIGNGLARIGVVLVISLLAGVSMGLLVKRIRGHIVANRTK